MASFRQICLPPYSLTRFIALLVPWSWVGDSWGCSQISRETSTYVQSATLDAHTDELLSVSSNDLEYLTPEEAEQIIDRFKKIPQSYDKLLFWTGIPREWAQQWADDHGMLTLTSAMGPLMNSKDQRCLRQGARRMEQVCQRCIWNLCPLCLQAWYRQSVDVASFLGRIHST
jgi:hypothetical protein